MTKSESKSCWNYLLNQILFLKANYTVNIKYMLLDDNVSTTIVYRWW